MAEIHGLFSEYEMRTVVDIEDTEKHTHSSGYVTLGHFSSFFPDFCVLPEYACEVFSKTFLKSGNAQKQIIIHSSSQLY